MLVRVSSLVVKELIQFRRDRLLSLFLLLAPALQLILMARAVERGIRQQPVAILDQDHSRLSRQLVAQIDVTEELRVKYYADNMEQMRALLDRGDARLAVVIPAGFARQLSSLAGTAPAILVVADGTNTIAASIAQAAAAAVVQRFSADLATSHGLTVPQPVDLRPSVQFNPTLDIRIYTIPAQLGFIVYQITLAVAALGLARERELGTLEQLMVRPFRRFELALGKGLPAIAIGMLNFAAMWAIGRAIFHLPMHGSAWLLAGLTLLFVTTVVGWGLVISSVSRTQQQAILFVFIQAMIDMTLSGFLVETKNMPAFLRFLSRFVPLQYYLGMIRSIMIKGASLPDLGPQVLALTALCLVMGAMAFRSVARRLE